MDIEKIDALQKEIPPADWLWPLLPTKRQLARHHWLLAEKKRKDGAKYLHRLNGLTAIVSGTVEEDGRRWLHLSIAHPLGLPSWESLRHAKELFLGRDSRAVQVLPPADEYVNIHQNCLHLWCCIDGDPLPDFTRGTGSI